MSYLLRKSKIFIYHALCFFFGSIVTLSLLQIDNENCMTDQLKEENYKYYKVSKWENPTLIVLVLSRPSNFERRAAIRETWLSLDTQNEIKSKHFFVLGSIGLSADTMLHLSTEQSRYNDLLFLPIVDKYSALTNKVLQSFVWLNEQIRYGLNFSYVLKCDDDSFVRIDALKVELNIISNERNRKQLNSSVFSISSQRNEVIKSGSTQIYWGYFYGNANVKKRGKWKETNWFLCDHYLPYAFGGGYVLSQGLVSFLAKNADDLQLYNSEDISVGNWLSPLTNIDRIHDIRFDTEYTSRGCLSFYLIYHKISVEDMKTMFANIKKLGKPCTNESIRKKHYLYDWNVLPSKCCIH